MAALMESLLIANRGEIACRIIRTARALGVRTIAVYSEGDRGALHTRLADVAVAIGPAAAAESYLRPERILAAAAQTHARAIHPGYGFLSENPAFADAVKAAGIIWVGPPASSIRAMGLKDAAKKLMAEAGVPVTPGYLGEDQDAGRLQREAVTIGFPVLIKAVAGGGGKGMRKVEREADFAAALTSCRREAAASFGDDRVLLEKYVTRPRHIEVQVFADSHGNAIHLFERDCSLQRRHQKVIEEAPAPGMDAATRTAVCGAAVKAALAVGYEGAGTVEFIADASAGLRADRIWFMEMNTRLQVEHPVTEAITGVDLVEWQLRVASGEVLPKRQEQLAITGHAMEARLYAENPASGFLPSTGPLTHFHLPTGIRIDTGVEQGAAVTPFYDPMIAKLIVHAPTRQAAAAKLSVACAEVEVWPVKTNAAFLARATAHPDFIAGAIDTGFIEARLEQLLPAAALSADALSAAARARLDIFRVAGSPWSSVSGVRLNADPRIEAEVQHGEQRQVVALNTATATRALPTVQLSGQTIVFDHGEALAFSEPQTAAAGSSATSDGAIRAPMPGRIIAVQIADGAAVVKGQPLVTMEAMKMEHTLTAPFDGNVTGLAHAVGEQVSEGTLLLQIGPGEIMAGRWFDEWHVGDCLVHEIRRTVTETDNLLISALTHNPQPLHLDAEFAAKTEFGRIIVNGTFTFALMIGLSVGDTTLGTLVANLGYDKVVMPKPVFVGDTLRAETEVVELKDSRSRPAAGIAIFRHRMLNQRDEIVCECLRTTLLHRKAA